MTLRRALLTLLLLCFGIFLAVARNEPALSPGEVEKRLEADIARQANCPGAPVDTKLDSIVRALFSVEQLARSKTYFALENGFATLFPWVAIDLFDMSLGPGQIKNSTVERTLPNNTKHLIGRSSTETVSHLLSECSARTVAHAILKTRFREIFDNEEKFLTRPELLKIGKFWNGQIGTPETSQHAFSNIVYGELLYEAYHFYVGRALKHSSRLGD